jgi:type I restriction enzyme S subunit
VMANIKIPLPSLKEQRKIADCLTSLDEVITAQTQAVDALKTHKTGLMQQLFPAEGETIPRLRFADFRDASGWEEKRLGDVADVITGSTPDTKISEYYNGDIPFYSPADISDDGGIIYKTAKTISKLGLNQIRVIPEKTILFVCIGSTIGKIGRAARPGATNQQINSIVPRNNLDIDYCYYIVLQTSGKIKKSITQQAVPIINKSTFSKLEIPIPPHPDEQRKIADCLTSLDEVITAQTAKLEALKAHKQALMQQLFPTETPSP